MNKEKESKENDIWIYIIGLIVVIGIIGLWYYTYFELKDLAPNDRGTLGDMFGTVNALFSGLAFAGIIFTILLQRKELRYQRDELKETRAEFIIQNKTLKNQRFENTFFNLLSLHHQIIEGIDFDTQVEKQDGKVFKNYKDKIEYEIVTVKGRDVFKDKFEILNQELSTVQPENFNDKYLEIYTTVQTDFGHYFRNLYRIIKYVESTEFISKPELNIKSDDTSSESILKYENENFLIGYSYTSMVRAQLSDYELLWIFYNCLSQNGTKKFRPLIEKFTLLKNMPKDKLYDERTCDLYDESAFKKTNPAHNTADN
ncbi:putative phage abortive infection protein [Bizionia sp.]|uniref:putative phage abortive infection protein n=1 Tax=Bizionia sp. TaxID=1954480 RepID=UPI003A9113F9